MKKFYCFKAGQKVPTWIWRVECRDRESMFKSRYGKVVFGVSCIAVRVSGGFTKLIPARNTDWSDKSKGYIKVFGYENCHMGGINGASGVEIYSDEMLKNHGAVLTYKVTNSKVERIYE